MFGPHLITHCLNLCEAWEVLKRKLKFELDKFLDLIPDEPEMLNCVTAARSNSILEQLSHRRAEVLYYAGGVSGSSTASKPHQVYQVRCHMLVLCIRSKWTVFYNCRNYELLDIQLYEIILPTWIIEFCWRYTYCAYFIFMFSLRF